MTDSAIQKTEALEILKGVLKKSKKPMTSQVTMFMHQVWWVALVVMTKW
jgi:hypothetical protein